MARFRPILPALIGFAVTALAIVAEHHLHPF